MVERFNSNEEPPSPEFSMEISLTIKELEDLVSYAKGNKIDIKYVVQNILDEINPEVYGVKNYDAN